MQEKMYKDISFNDQVTITIPAHIAFAALTEYSATELSGHNVNALMGALLRELLLPAYLKAIQAQMHEQAERQQAMAAHVENMLLNSTPLLGDEG